MIHPAPTSKIDPTLARGVLEEIVEPTAQKQGYVVLSFPNTSYRVHLVPTGPITTGIGKRILGTVEAVARRVDVVNTGGKYVEPVYGRPRRVQGRVIATDAGTNTITVDAGFAIRCRLTDPRQTPGQFAEGILVSFDVLDGATFTPAA